MPMCAECATQVLAPARLEEQSHEIWRMVLQANTAATWIESAMAGPTDLPTKLCRALAKRGKAATVLGNSDVENGELLSLPADGRWGSTKRKSRQDKKSARFID